MLARTQGTFWLPAIWLGTSQLPFAREMAGTASTMTVASTAFETI